MSNKTNNLIASRLKTTGGSQPKVKRKSCGKSHLKGKKNSKKIRKLRKDQDASNHMKKALKLLGNS
jgi:ribosomal protein L35